MRYKIRLSYNGSAFSGWQIQNNAKTVQESIQKALSILLKEPITITGAGRTDTGVNAINYIAHFDYNNPNNKDNNQLVVVSNTFIYKLNAITEKEVIIHEITEVKEDFHARFDAQLREYKYYVHTSRNPFIGNFSFFYNSPLDIEKMNKAASLIIGEKDFSCFEKKGSDNKTSICKLSYAKWEYYNPTPSHTDTNNTCLVFTIRADRFLRNMVRAIVGTLLEIGRGKYEPEWILEVLKSKDRCHAGESVAGNALFLTKIEY